MFNKDLNILEFINAVKPHYSRTTTYLLFGSLYPKNV